MPDAAALFLAHRDGVFRYLCRIVGHSETARDLTQEVFLRVTRANEEGRPLAIEDNRAWIFRIARNLALNHVRDEGRRPPLAPVEVDAGRHATQEIALAVERAVAALSDLDRDVFVLRESAGLGYDEIARACEISPDAVRSRLHRARQALRASLEGLVTRQLGAGVRLFDREKDRS